MKTRPGLAPLIGLVLIVLFCFPSFGRAVQVTDDADDDALPFIDSGYIVWRGYDGNDWEVYLHEISTGITTQLTDNAYDDGLGPCAGDPVYECDKPRVRGGYAVWTGYDGNDWEIYLYNIGTATTTQLTDNSTDDYTPRLDESLVAWVGWPVEAVIDSEIYLYEIATSTITRLTNNEQTDINPWVSQGRVSWRGFDGSDYEVFYYDSATSITTRVTDNDYDEVEPKINPYLISWRGLVDTDGEVFAYELAGGATRRVTNNLFVEQDMRPDMTDNAVVWAGCDGPDCATGSGDWEIYHYNGSTRLVTRITNNTGEDELGWAEGGEVVWSGSDGSDFEIFHYDAATGARQQLTDNALDESVPRVQNGTVIWMGNDGNDWEIFYTALDPAPDIRANGSAEPLTITQGDQLVVTVSLDPRGGDGQDADWWASAATPLGTYWYTPDGWVLSGQPVRGYAGPLTTVTDFVILDTATLPVGPLFIYFAIDDNMDGVLDATWMDFVAVRVLR